MRGSPAVTDHLQDAKDKVTEAFELLNRQYGIRAQDVAFLIFAVRHQVAEEIRTEAEDPETRYAGWPTLSALQDLSGQIDPYRFDPTTGQWGIK